MGDRSPSEETYAHYMDCSDSYDEEVDNKKYFNGKKLLINPFKIDLETNFQNQDNGEGASKCFLLLL